MPRDPSGNYTLPALGNPAVTNTPITIAWWNGTSTDMAAAFTDSLSRTGAGGMLAPFTLVDGTAATPAFAFQSETNTGFYRVTAGEMDVSVLGTRYSRWTVAGFQESFDGGATWKNPLYNNNGNQTFTGGLDFTLGSLTVGGSAIRPVTISGTASCGTFTTALTTYQAITNLNLTFTATGGVVVVQLLSDTTATPAFISAVPTAGGSTVPGTGFGSLELAMSADGGSTFFSQQRFDGFAPWTGISYNPPIWGPSSFTSTFQPSAGPGKTIALYARASPGLGSTVTVANCRLLITQF